MGVKISTGERKPVFIKASNLTLVTTLVPQKTPERPTVKYSHNNLLHRPLRKLRYSSLLQVKVIGYTDVFDTPNNKQQDAHSLNARTG